MSNEFKEWEVEVGNVAVCARSGEVGVVEFVNQSCGSLRCGLTTYFGKTLDGQRWESLMPRKLADSVEAYRLMPPHPKPIAFDEKDEV